LLVLLAFPSDVDEVSLSGNTASYSRRTYTFTDRRRVFVVVLCGGGDGGNITVIIITIVALT
jgi:hypothetical protein